MATPTEETTGAKAGGKGKSQAKKPAKPKRMTLQMRRNLYDERHHPTTAMMLKATGYTEEEIADILGINPDTLYTWKKKYPAFAEALKMTAAQANSQVKASLFKRAIGYEYEETKTSVVKKGDGTQETKVEKIHKTVIPDTTAQIFWLKNKCPEEFKDVIDNRLSGGVGIGADQDAGNLKEILKKDPAAKDALRSAFDKLFPGGNQASGQG